MHTYAAAMSAKDPRVGRAVQLWQKSPALTVEQVMLAAEFSPVDAKFESARRGSVAAHL